MEEQKLQNALENWQKLQPLSEVTKEDGGCLLRRRCNLFSEAIIVAELAIRTALAGGIRP